MKKRVHNVLKQVYFSKKGGGWGSELIKLEFVKKKSEKKSLNMFS